MNRPALLSLVLLAVACGPTFFVEGEVQSVCKRVGEFTVDGVPQALAAEASKVGITREVPFDLSKVASVSDDVQGLATDARLAEVTLTPTQGVTSFSFVEEASLELLPPPGSALPTGKALVLAKQADGGTLTLALEDRDLDLRPYLDQGKGTLKAHLKGTPPTTSWGVAVDACIHVTAHYDLPALGK